MVESRTGQMEYVYCSLGYRDRRMRRLTTTIFRPSSKALSKSPPVLVTVAPENRANLDREALRDLPQIVARILEARRDFYRNGQRQIDLVLSKDLCDELLSVAKSGEVDLTTEPSDSVRNELDLRNELPPGMLQIR